MLGFAVIRKESLPSEHLDYQRWCALIGEFPELRRIDVLDFGGEQHAAAGSAELLQEGEVVGLFIWDNGQIYIDGPYSMFSLAQIVADILDAKIFDDSGDLMLEAPEEEEE